MVSKKLLLLLLLIPSFVIAQKKPITKTEEGEYTLRVEANVSVQETEKKALELAQINAIENAFGKVIMQGNSTFIQNNNTGQKVETVNVFNFVSDSYVNGEWIETLSEKKERFYDDKNDLWIKYKVKGKIREITTPNPCFVASPLSCPDSKCKTTSFNNEQDLFVFFKSSKDGYVTIYLDDPQMDETFRILPYQKQTGNYAINIPVEQDKEYIFFSKKKDVLGDMMVVDELLMETKDAVSTNKLFVIFSPEPFDKPILTDKNNELQPSNDGSKSIYPKSLKSIEFQKWLQNLRIKNQKVDMQSYLIDIRK